MLETRAGSVYKKTIKASDTHVQSHITRAVAAIESCFGLVSGAGAKRGALHPLR